MRILITGGYGYLGARIGQYLESVGHRVVLGTARSNFQVPDCLAGFTSTHLNWLDSGALRQACQDSDVVIHAAGMNARNCADNPVAALQFNGVATARLAQAAAQARVRRFVYLSTAHVYCAPLNGVITEDTCPRNSHVYATSHLAGENAVLGVTCTHKMSGVVLRLSNVVGAPAYSGVDAWMLLVNDLCRQVALRKSMILSGNSGSMRDFLPLSTALRLIADVVEGSISVGPILNVGAGRSRSVHEMAGMIQQVSREVLEFTPEIHPSSMNEAACSGPLIYLSKYREMEQYHSGEDELRREISELLYSCRNWFCE